MDSAWIGVIGGLVGGIVGASGAVISQIIGGRNQLAAQSALLAGQLDSSRDQWERERVAVAEQWAEEKRTRLRDERKALYARYGTLVRAISVFGLEGRDGLLALGDEADRLIVAIDEIDGVAEQIELTAGDDVRAKVKLLGKILEKIHGEIHRAQWAPDQRRIFDSFGFTSQLEGGLDAFLAAARGEVT